VVKVSILLINFFLLLITFRVACDFPNCQFVAVYANALTKHKNYGMSTNYFLYTFLTSFIVSPQHVTQNNSLSRVHLEVSRSFSPQKAHAVRQLSLSSNSFSNSVCCSVHTGEKPFKCTNEGCDRAFCDRKGLRNHEEKCLHPQKLKPGRTETS
jgi:hypothetical protein